jgi:catechol 2,3-dioxygenase-like lactoylglutathione lyase family enzyme
LSLKHNFGLDHVVVAVRDLDASASRWKRLGFTLSARGVHSALMGTANCTVVFREDYIELLGVVADTDQNKSTRDFLRLGEGIERAAFATDDAAAGVAELKSRGLDAIGPLSFGRPVDWPGGGKAEARFDVFLWPLNRAPSGLGIFACQHLTRDAVWIPDLQTHANGALRIERVEIVSARPKAAAEQLGGLIDELASPVHDGSWRVRSGGGRATFLFYDRAAFARRYPDTVRAGAAREGAVALVIGSSDLAAAADALGTLAVAHEDAVSAPATAANGVIVSFVAL